MNATMIQTQCPECQRINPVKAQDPRTIRPELQCAACLACNRVYNVQAHQAPAPAPGAPLAAPTVTDWAGIPLDQPTRSLYLCAGNHPGALFSADAPTCPVAGCHATVEYCGRDTLPNRAAMQQPAPIAWIGDEPPCLLVSQTSPASLPGGIPTSAPTASITTTASASTAPPSPATADSTAAVAVTVSCQGCLDSYLTPDGGDCPCRPCDDCGAKLAKDCTCEHYAPEPTPELPPYNPEDGAPCAQCGHGQELHVNGTAECWETSDTTPPVGCPCPRYQAREAAQRADEAELGGPTTSIACDEDGCSDCTWQACTCPCHAEPLTEEEIAYNEDFARALTELANRGLPPIMGGAPTPADDPAGPGATAEAARYYVRSWQGTRYHIVPTAAATEGPALCGSAVLPWAPTTSDHYSSGAPLPICQHCQRRADRQATPHTHPCPTCHQARACTGTGCVDGPRECNTCSQCRGW